MNATILLIEDKSGLRDTIKSLLELHDFLVITATNGEQGLALARKHLPDLVISDVYMPVLNGYQLLERFKEDDVLNKIPVIMLSAKNEAAEVDYAIQQGAAGYVTKPFLFKQLHETIKQLISPASPYP